MRTQTTSLFVLAASAVAIIPGAQGWVLPTSATTRGNAHDGNLSFFQRQQHRLVRTKTTTPPTVLFSGFGGGDTNKKNKSKPKKEPKLKPKQQWDRYLDMKKETKVRVAVRVSLDDVSAVAEWLEVGNVKSKQNKYTALALARQRILVAEHARRLFPLQIAPREPVLWAYWNEELEEWTIVKKSVLDDVKNVPANLERLIGFEGRPDPSSGFYCVYNEGRLVNESDDSSRPSSKKRK